MWGDVETRSLKGGRGTEACPAREQEVLMYSLLSKFEVRSCCWICRASRTLLFQ